MSIFDTVSKALKESINKYANEAEKIMKREAPTGRTGALEDSITTEKVSDYHYKVGVDASALKSNPNNISGFDYSVVVAEGNKRAYKIRPLRASGFLKWTDRNGQVHYAKEVTHPKTDPNPFVQRTVRKMKKFKL
jgi:hypothetical protein